MDFSLAVGYRGSSNINQAGFPPSPTDCVGPLGWLRKTKVVQSFSASILCEGHIYKDFGNTFLKKFRNFLGVPQGGQLFKKWIFKLLRLPCWWYSKLVPWDADHSWKGIGLIQSLSAEKTSKTCQNIHIFVWFDNCWKLQILAHFGRFISTERSDQSTIVIGATWKSTF